MTTTSITFQQADRTDIEHVKSLLDANDLPSQDVQATGACFFLAYANMGTTNAGGA